MRFLAFVMVVWSTTASLAQTEYQPRPGLKDDYDRVVVMIAIAQAIETNCPGFRSTGEMVYAKATLGKLADRAGIGADLDIQLAMAGVAASEHYELRRRPREFCKRALQDWGPGTVQPVVERSR